MVMHKLVSNGQFDKYKDLELNKEIEVGTELDLTIKRADEVNQALKKYEIKWVRVKEEE